MNQQEYNNFIKENRLDDLFLYIIYSDNCYHPIKLIPSIIFIKNCKTDSMSYISLNHQDDVSEVPLKTIIDDLNNKFVGRLFVLDKKSFIQTIPVKSVLDINLGLHFINEKLINPVEFQTISHKFINQIDVGYKHINNIIPLLKHKEMVEELYKKCVKKIINNDIFNEKYYLSINSIITESLSDLELNGIYVDKIKFKKYFPNATIYNNYVYSQYNIITSTGRPSNRFDGVNYSALHKDDGSRECFISRFGDNGLMSLIDYSSFHPRIICELINFKLDINIDFYEYIAKLFYKKSIVDETDIKDAKTLTFKQLYGGVEERYDHIQYFYNLSKFIEYHWNEFNKHGYTVTPYFNRKISKDQIEDANPNKLFNYILQATETEIMVPIINKVNNLLKDKHSKPVLYTYDSILFDTYKNELGFIKNDIANLMMSNNKFPIKFYTGLNYNNMTRN